MSALNTTPLTEPIDRADVRAHRAKLRAEGKLGSRDGLLAKLATALTAAAVVVFGVFFLVTFSRIISAQWSGGALFRIVPLAMLLVAAAAIVVVIVRLVRGRSPRARSYRLDRFAKANGMSWTAETRAPNLPGMIFSLGYDRVATDTVRAKRPVPFEVANYKYTVGSGRYRSDHRWGYVAVRLRHALPHIVLDAVGNNSLLGSNLPASLDRDQRLRLEGDFDKYFTLSCPAGYERDALYLFTPDIMARFIDNAAALDVEIVDDYMFLYAKRPLSTVDPATWQWLASVVEALTAKIEQWERWRDERLTPTEPVIPAASGQSTAPALLRPPPGVAEGGRRLKRKLPWSTVVIFVLVLGFILARQAGIL